MIRVEDDFEEYSDDPDVLDTAPSKGKLPKILALIVFAISGSLFLQTTLASNITINSGKGIQFGQGISRLVACSGATPLTITPKSGFVNASGGGAHYFSSITVSNIPASCQGLEFSIQAYNNTNSSPLVLFNTVSTKAVVDYTAGIFERGVRAAGTTVTSKSGSFTIEFDVPVALSSSVYKLTVETGDQTLLSAGDRGPGNGIVFYVSATYFTSEVSACNTKCRYLEVAPADWTGSIVDDPQLQWQDYVEPVNQDHYTIGNEGYNSVFEKFNWKIGEGRHNTQLIHQSTPAGGGGISPAEIAAYNYAGTDGSGGEWFLPSVNELNELCKYSRGQATGNPKVACNSGGTLKSTASAGGDRGGFNSGIYWSSSEWQSDPGQQTTTWQSFSDGTQGAASKTTAQYVRPIRAF